MAPDLSAEALLAWVTRYEHAWRTRDTRLLRDVFTQDAVYLTEPYAEPVVGLAAIEQLWLEESEADEVFHTSYEVVACQGATGVIRADVRYGDPVRQEYLDLWVLTIDGRGLASRFEEWPFWPTHGRSPLRAPPTLAHASDVPATPYGEWVRSAALSGGVYRLAAGAEDGQSPHAEDEVYVVTAGAAHLDVAGVRTPVRAGTLAYFPRRVPHRFVDITEDLEVAVVFAPPEATD